MLRALLLFALLAASGPARAEEAASLADQAARLFSQAQFKASLRLLQRARARASEPATLGRIHLYIGLNQAALGEQQKARRSFATALTHDPLLRLEAGRFRPDLIAMLEEVRDGLRGELVVTAQEPGLQVIVDGGAPRPPGRQKLPIGAHRVEVRAADGRTALAERVIIRVGEAVMLTPRRLPPLPRSFAQVALRPVQPPQDVVPLGKRRRVWTWVVGGAAVAAAIVAMSLGLVANKTFNEKKYDPRTRDNGCYDGDPTQGCDTPMKLDLAANVIFGVGGALAITSVVLFFVEGRTPRRAPASVRLVPSLGGGAVVGSF